LIAREERRRARLVQPRLFFIGSSESGEGGGTQFTIH
jgi:hypothetical protein